MAIIDRIKYDGNTNGTHWLIHKCSSEQFVLGSQLIVNQGQEALFFKGGTALDLFGPGTFTLTTGNLPILNELVNIPFGNKTPFTAEIYYINKTAKLDLKWGTSTPIPLEDPKYGIILNIRARGQYGIIISDSRLFVNRIIGAIPNGVTINHILILKYFNGIINTKIKSLMSEYMMKKQISFLEISQYLSELSEAFEKSLTAEFKRFGIQLVNLYCEAIVPNPGEYEKLQGYKQAIALGKAFYKERRTLDILEKTAENSSLKDMIKSNFNLKFDPIIEKENINSLVTCQHCGVKNNVEFKYCEHCGNKLYLQVRCPYCDEEVSIDDNFCGHCGNPLNLNI